MKKLILMLCACTIAFAGLLTSCKNETEEYIDVTQSLYDYIYSVTGTMTIVEETGTPGATSKTTTTYTITQGSGSAEWWEQTNYKSDVINIEVGVNARSNKNEQTDDQTPVVTYNTYFPYSNYSFYYVSKIDGKYYIKNDVSAEYEQVNISGIKEKGFTYSGSYTHDWSTESNVNKTTYSVDLTFDKPVK